MRNLEGITWDGLYYVDFKDPYLKRYPKLSAHWYSSFLGGTLHHHPSHASFSSFSALWSFKSHILYVHKITPVDLYLASEATFMLACLTSFYKYCVWSKKIHFRIKAIRKHIIPGCLLHFIHARDNAVSSNPNFTRFGYF